MIDNLEKFANLNIVNINIINLFKYKKKLNIYKKRKYNNYILIQLK